MQSSKLQRSSRGEQKAATQRLLREAARRCFEDKGFAATTIGEITAAAGVAHGTFYVHFSSKEALMDQLLGEFNLELVERLSPQLCRLGQEPLRQTVEATVERFIEHFEARSAFVESYMQRLAKGLDRRNLQGGVNQPMLLLLSRALEARSPSRDQDDLQWELVAHGILAMALRISLQYLFDSKVTKQHTVSTIVRLTVGAVKEAR